MSVYDARRASFSGPRFHNYPYVYLLLGVFIRVGPPRKSDMIALLADPVPSPDLMGTSARDQVGIMDPLR